MAWSFSLFIVGLSILITVQSLLMWCSRLDNYPFSTPKLWEFFLGVGVYGACGAVVGAIALLVVTVLSLHFNVGDGGSTYSNPNASPWDAHLAFSVRPKWAAIVAFAVSKFSSFNHTDLTTQRAVLNFILYVDLVSYLSPHNTIQFIGAGIIVALLVFILFSMANSVKLLLWRRSIERSNKYRVKLDDLV